MLLSASEFAAAFPGEDEHIEFKQGVSPSRAQEAAVAFSNADGGVLLAGVAPGGQIVGVAHPGEKTKDLHQALRDARDPGRYDVRALLVEGKTVLVLSVARRREGFSQTSSGAVLMRRGASNVALLGADLSRFLARQKFESFELTPTAVPLDMIDPFRSARLAEVFGWSADDRTTALLEAGFAGSNLASRS